MVDNRTTHYGGRNPPPLIDLLKMCFLMLVTENLDMWWDPTYILIIQAQLAAIGSLEEIGRVDKEKRINWMLDFYALVLPLVIHDTYIWKWDFIEFNLRFPGVVAFITAALNITLEEWEERGPGDGWNRMFSQRVLQKYFHNIPIVEGLLNIGTGRGPTMMPIYDAANGRLNAALRFLIPAELPDFSSLEANQGYVRIRRFVPATGFTQNEKMRFVLETANDSDSWTSAAARLRRLENGPGVEEPPQQQPPPQPQPRTMVVRPKEKEIYAYVINGKIEHKARIMDQLTLREIKEFGPTGWTIDRIKDPERLIQVKWDSTKKITWEHFKGVTLMNDEDYGRPPSASRSRRSSRRGSGNTTTGTNNTSVGGAASGVDRRTTVASRSHGSNPKNRRGAGTSTGTNNIAVGGSGGVGSRRKAGGSRSNGGKPPPGVNSSRKSTIVPIQITENPAAKNILASSRVSASSNRTTSSNNGNTVVPHTRTTRKTKNQPNKSTTTISPPSKPTHYHTTIAELSSSSSSLSSKLFDGSIDTDGKIYGTAIAVLLQCQNFPIQTRATIVQCAHQFLRDVAAIGVHPGANEQIGHEAMISFCNCILQSSSRLVDRRIDQCAQQFLHSVRDDIRNLIHDIYTVGDGYDRLDSNRNATQDQLATAARFFPELASTVETSSNQYSLQFGDDWKRHLEPLQRPLLITGPLITSNTGTSLSPPAHDKGGNKDENCGDGGIADDPFSSEQERAAEAARNKNGHQNPHQQPWRVEEDAVTAVDNCAADEEDTTSIDRSASSFLTIHKQAKITTLATATATAAMQCAERTPEVQHRRCPPPPAFTADENEQLRQILYEDHDDEDPIILPYTALTIGRAPMRTLRPETWLNDDPVNIFFQNVLTQRDQQLCVNDPQRKRSHFFGSFFMTNLLNDNTVARWSKKVPLNDIFDLDKIFCPINVSNLHWILGIIDMTKKEILILDSNVEDKNTDAVATTNRCAYALFQYLLDEHREKKKNHLPNAFEWKIITSSMSANIITNEYNNNTSKSTLFPTPQQDNGDDCGVFICYFATSILVDDPITSFDLQGYINDTNGRERIALSILNGKVVL